MILHGRATTFNRVINVDPAIVVPHDAIQMAGARIPLLVDHDWSRNFASTCKGTLHVDVDRWGVWFEAEVEDFDLEGDVLSGRRVECSVLYDPIVTHEGIHHGQPVIFFDRCRVREISLVPWGACPGTGVWPADSPTEQITSRQAAAREMWTFRMNRQRLQQAKDRRRNGVPPAPAGAAEASFEVRPASKRTSCPPSLVALMRSPQWAAGVIAHRTASETLKAMRD